jgi:CHAT domain-containing protein/Flp pilus assembly protein TadD
MNNLSGNPITGNALPLDRRVLHSKRLNDLRRQTILAAAASHELYEATMHQGRSPAASQPLSVARPSKPERQKTFPVRTSREIPQLRWLQLAACALVVMLTLLSTTAMAGLFEECTALFERGNQAYKRGDYPKAVEYLERAARIAENAYGPDSPNVSLVYNSLSTAYLVLGRYNEAEPFLLRAMQIRERTAGPSSPEFVTVLSNTALLYDNQGRYGEAETLYKRGMAIEQAAAGPDHPSVAVSLGGLANLYQHQGRYSDAEAAYRQALSILEKTYGTESPNLLFIIDNLGALYGNAGRFEDAIRIFERSLTIKQKNGGPNNQTTTPTLTSIASMYDNDGRFADAEQLYKRVLAISEANHDTAAIAAALNNLAAFYRVRDRLAEAEPLYQRSLTLQQKAHGPNHPDVATVLSNLAVLYDRQGRSAEAEQLYKRGLAIDQQTFGPNSNEAASDMRGLALLYEHLGRAAEAEPLFKQALAIRESSPLYDPTNIAFSLSGLAAFYDDQGRLPEALAAARKAVGIWSVNGTSAWDPNAIHNSNQQMMRDFLPEMIHILFQAYSGAGTAGLAIADEAFRASQSAQGIETAQALAGMTARYAANSDALGMLIREQQDLSNQAQALNASLVKVLSQAPNQRSAKAEAALRDELRLVEAKLKADDDRVHKDFPRFVELARAQPVGIADVQQVLGPDEAFAAMTLAQKDGYLFVIRKHKASFFKLDLTRSQAAEAVKALRANLVDDKPFDTGKAHDLYQKLFGQADSLIADAGNLIVVPDGALESLPFSVLVTATGDQSGKPADYKHVAWLIRRQALTVVPAASSFVSLRNLPLPRRADDPFIGFGDPALQGTGAKRGIDTTSLYKGGEAAAKRLESLPSLPETADELRAEAKLLGAPATSLHLGDNASVTTVKSLDLSHTRIIAFATHAGVAGELANLNEPALVLSPPALATPDDDGLLRASQISQLRLNAEFVILSACNTAASDGTPGAEGLSGLAKAFFYAGARSLLVSHWEVQTDPTVKLTTGLIRALAADPSIGRAEALRRSILAMIDSTSDEEDNHPAAWAPFVLAGEGGARR